MYFPNISFYMSKFRNSHFPWGNPPPHAHFLYIFFILLERFPPISFLFSGNPNIIKGKLNLLKSLCPFFFTLLSTPSLETIVAGIYITICPGSRDPFYTVSYYIKWVTTSWTHSINAKKKFSWCHLCFML